MLSLVEQLHNFLAEWQANQEMSGKAGVGEGRCALCDRQRFVRYQIDVDAEFCSPQCFARYQRIVAMGRTYAG